MSNRTITHEIKLEKSVKIIIGIFAIGVFLNVFSPLLETKSALAELSYGDSLNVTVSGSMSNELSGTVSAITY